MLRSFDSALLKRRYEISCCETRLYSWKTLLVPAFHFSIAWRFSLVMCSSPRKYRDTLRRFLLLCIYYTKHFEISLTLQRDTTMPVTQGKVCNESENVR